MLYRLTMRIEMFESIKLYKHRLISRPWITHFKRDGWITYWCIQLLCYPQSTNSTPKSRPKNVSGDAVTGGYCGRHRRESCNIFIIHDDEWQKCVNVRGWEWFLERNCHLGKLEKKLEILKMLFNEKDKLLNKKFTECRFKTSIDAFRGRFRKRKIKHTKLVSRQVRL